MKKFLLVLTTMLFAIVALAGCGANNKQSSNEKVIKVGATTVPHAEILEQVKEDLAKDVLEIITVFSARLYGARSRKNQKLITAMRKAVRDSEE